VYILRIQLHSSKISDGVYDRCPKSKQNNRARRQCDRCTFNLLPYVRPSEAPDTSCRDDDQLHPHIASNLKFVLDISADTAGSTARA
jgi:hypothetical protein